MKPTFATNTANVAAFLTAAASLDRRGAPEAAIMLVTGEAGHGKSRTVLWHSIQNSGLLIRAKAAYTPSWLLRDILGELGLHPDHSTELMFRQIIASLARDEIKRPLILDEVEHACSSRKVLETIRDIADLTEIPVILVGMSGVEKRLQRYPQIYSRISQIVKFGALDAAGVTGLCQELCEVPVAADACAVIQRATGGYMRELMDAIAEVERLGKRLRREVTAADLANVRLTGGRAARPGQGGAAVVAMPARPAAVAPVSGGSVSGGGGQ